METRLFVGNLPYSITEEELEEVFVPHGTVVSTVIVRDRETGRSRGFGFVEMETEESAATARQAMDGFELGGRPLRVNEAQPRKSRRPRSDDW